MIWKLKKRSLDLSRQARVMGILNVTPDSFSDGGKYEGLEKAMARAREMVSQGATIIDVGGESTRPGATPVGADEETHRIFSVIAALRAEWDGFISIDTTKCSVAAVALAAGADIINDISGLTAEPEMAELCAMKDCGIVVMHMQGSPETMQENPVYENVTGEIQAFFQERLATLTALGISPDRICFDPGIGFGKSLAHNLELLRNIARLAPAGSPLLLGVSRKSFLAKTTAATEPTDRDAPTAALTALTRSKGIMLHRVHAVKENLAALRITEALLHQK